MDYAGLGAWIGAHYGQPGDRLFRLEALPEYAVDDDGDDFRRWLAGAPEPTWARKQPWLDTLRREHDAGLHATRVRIFTPALTDYERYACEFGYALNAPAGEDIRVLRRGEHPIPDDAAQVDFWLASPIPDEGQSQRHHVALMHYDELGRFLGAEEITGDAQDSYLRTHDALWPAAEPFGSWWAQHPELNRRRAA